jgi:hypothetical protein
MAMFVWVSRNFCWMQKAWMCRRVLQRGGTSGLYPFTVSEEDQNDN